MKYNNPRFLFRRYEVMRKVRKSGHFLEIGPGNLSLALELLTKFNRGMLIDFNTTDVREIYDGLRDEYKQRLQLVIGDFLEFNQMEMKFDCVVACEVLEHVENDRQFLRKAHEYLKSGGQLILSVPARQKYWSKDDEIVGHYRRYEKEDLYAKLVEAGYSQIEIASYGFPFQNLVRLGRISLARFQYREKAGWDQRKQSQQSAFMLKSKPYLNIIGLVLNKYTMYPFSLFASLFNGMDLSEGYLACAIKDSN